MAAVQENFRYSSGGCTDARLRRRRDRIPARGQFIPSPLSSIHFPLLFSTNGGCMIIRRYGTTVQSVQPNFDARAMTEISFRRTSGYSASFEEFSEAYERVDERALTATAEGDVKDEAERALLDSLQ